MLQDPNPLPPRAGKSLIEPAPGPPVFCVSTHCLHRFSGGVFSVLVLLGMLFLTSCSLFGIAYKVTETTVKTTYHTAKFATRAGIATGKATYTIGCYTYKVLKAPLDWALTHDIDSIDGLSPREAIRQGRVKYAPYRVNNRTYVPMSPEEAIQYRENGIASWYGEETRSLPGGAMTANGEVFDPDLPTAAHKYLPLPTNVKVTNLDNGRSIVVRVNDRGPFIRGRIIDLSAGSARRLDFYEQGTARVMVETVEE